MSEATKIKLKHFGVSDEVADKLEQVGLLFPHQIKAATDKQLEESGLSKNEVKALRVKLPKVK